MNRVVAGWQNMDVSVVEGSPVYEDRILFALVTHGGEHSPVRVYILEDKIVGFVKNAASGR